MAVPEPVEAATTELFGWLDPAPARVQPIVAGEDPTVLVDPRDPEVLLRVLTGLRRL